MNIRRLSLAAFLLIAAASTLRGAPTPPPTYEGHVRASLISDVSNIRAGRAFTIGVLLEIEQGWHIYWTNPGDSGMPTTVTFKAPEGFEAVPDPFPIPARIRHGKETAYGYERPVVFTAKVTPPVDLRIGDRVTFEASAAWLVCKDTCLPGKATESLTMKVADRTGPTNVDLFQRNATTVAGPNDRLNDIAGVRGTIDPKTHIATLTIHWKTPCTGVQVFPGAVDGVTVDKITVKKTEDDLTPITMKIEITPDQKPAANRLPLLISFRDSEGHMRGLQANVPVK